MKKQESGILPSRNQCFSTVTLEYFHYTYNFFYSYAGKHKLRIKNGTQL